MPTVLVIDDDETLRGIVRAMLEAAGFAVDEAEDGAEGLKRYRERPADVVLCDVFMPAKEGLQTILDLRREFAGARVVVMSGALHGEVDYERVARRFGAVGAVEKPFGEGALVAAVRAALDGP